MVRPPLLLRQHVLFILAQERVTIAQNSVTIAVDRCGRATAQVCEMLLHASPGAWEC